jgi:hypothetical protein
MAQVGFIGPDRPGSLNLATAMFLGRLAVTPAMHVFEVLL